MVALRQVGTIAPYRHAAFSPGGQTLYVVHDGSAIVAYDFPSLDSPSIVATPESSGGSIEGIACDDAGVLYWWELTGSFGLRLYNQGSMFYDTVDERGPVGLCWFDGLLYGFGLTDVTDGECLCSWDPTVPGGDRTVLYTPPIPNDALGFVNNPVPTPDGAIWWSYPDTPSSSSTIHRYDIAGATGGFAGFHLADVFIPRPEFSWAYGTPQVGGVGAAGYFFHPDASFDWPLALLDGFTPGPRAAAWTPDFARVCFERGATGEVWSLGGGFHLGKVGFSGTVPGLNAVLNTDISASVFDGSPQLQETGNWSVFGDLAGVVPGGGAGIIATLDPGTYQVTLALTGYSVFDTTLSFGVPSDLHAISGSASFTVTVPSGPAQVLGVYRDGPAPPEAAWTLGAGSVIRIT